MTNILQLTIESPYGQGNWFCKPSLVEKQDEKTVKITFEITENVGTNEQKTHNESAVFEAVPEWEDYFPFRSWMRLDPIDEESISYEVFKWADVFNAIIKKEAAL